MKIRVTVVVVPDGDGFHAYCPALKGLHMPGETEQEALGRIPDAVEVYLRSLERYGDPLPVGPDFVIEKDRPHAHQYEAPANSTLKKVDILWPKTSLAAPGIS